MTATTEKPAPLTLDALDALDALLRPARPQHATISGDAGATAGFQR